MTLEDKNAILKYFYLIDTERLAEKVTERLYKDNPTEPDDIFQIMYSEINETCKPYLEFTYSANSFNRADGYDIYPAQIQILNETLKNHCILHGFQSAVKGKADETLQIRGKNHEQLRHGYFGGEHFKDKPSPVLDEYAPDKTISMYYNGYKHRFLDHLDSYSYSILKKSSIGPCKDFPTVQSYDGNWGCFIFTDRHVFTLDKNISDHSSAIITNYEKLLKASVQWCKTNGLLPEDRFLFDSAMEQIYGFRFFSYAAKLLNRVCTDSPSSANSGITYKDLEGSALLNVIQQTARLPVAYNHSVFLEHAICSVMHSKYLKDLEYQEKPNSLFSHTSREPAPTLLLVTSGLEQIRKYLQKLKHIALPLLENVWDSLTDKLNNGDSRFSISMDAYRAYVKSNLAAMAQDYSHYFESDETLRHFQPDFLCHTEHPEDEYSLWQNFSFKDILLSKFERDSFSTLLFDYFDAERFPIRQTDLCYLLTPYSNIAKTEPEKHTVELNFYKCHFQNILSFAENISPFIESNALHPAGKY